MIQIKNAKELDGMRRANALSAAALKYGGEHIEAGMTTWELDKIIYDFIIKHGGKPNFKGLYGFPGTMILSQEAAKGAGESPEEVAAIEGAILPKMIIAGFATVTITSVIVTGLIAARIGS